MIFQSKRDEFTASNMIKYGTFEHHDPLVVLEAVPIKPGLLQKIKAKWLSLFEKDVNK